MQNKIFLMLFSMIFITTFVYADDDHDITVKSVLTEIRENLNLSADSEINPDKVPDRLLEKLGEALMNELHPNEREHEYMDEMMGGEGSESLKAMHRAMGYRYLSGQGYGSGMMMGPFNNGFYNGSLGRHMSGWRNINFGMPMNGQFYGWTRFGGITMGLVFFLFLGAVLLLAFYVMKKGRLPEAGNVTALEILKRRYANGEITKEEFEKIKSDII